MEAHGRRSGDTEDGLVTLSSIASRTVSKGVSPFSALPNRLCAPIVLALIG